MQTSPSMNRDNSVFNLSILSSVVGEIPIVKKTPSEYLEAVAALMKERVEFVTEFATKAYYFFCLPDYDLMKTNEAKDFNKILKSWDADRKAIFLKLTEEINNVTEYKAALLQQTVEGFISDNNLKFGDVLPVLRLALSGTMKGPGVFEMMEVLGKEEVELRLKQFFEFCDSSLVDN
jgi:glutamyl-tRNA synthetase